MRRWPTGWPRPQPLIRSAPGCSTSAWATPRSKCSEWLMGKMHLEMKMMRSRLILFPKWPWAQMPFLGLTLPLPYHFWAGYCGATVLWVIFPTQPTRIPLQSPQWFHREWVSTPRNKSLSSGPGLETHLHCLLPRGCSTRPTVTVIQDACQPINKGSWVPGPLLTHTRQHLWEQGPGICILTSCLDNSGRHWGLRASESVGRQKEQWMSPGYIHVTRAWTSWSLF